MFNINYLSLLPSSAFPQPIAKVTPQRVLQMTEQLTYLKQQSNSLKYKTENTISSNQGEYLNGIINLLADVEKVSTDIYG